MKHTSVVLAGLLIAASASPAWCAGPVERYALVVGANSGGPGRAELRYAVSDAEHFARVMVELGGVAAQHEILLRQPKLRDLADAFDTLTRYVNDGRRGGGRTEVVLYYSGHADETGLVFGGERYAYSTLRDRLAQIPADVRIAILDACSSGAFTRVKSGKPRPPFMVDESSDMHGHAFLTSSSESEAAQESDRIRASYFTHYLLSGFRGAADLSGDGKVTLNEAYQFAFNETLGRTIDTKGGAQHPSYDISMSGTGDVVMTDVRQTNATLVLSEDLDGRLFIRTAAHELVVELYKPRGRRVEIAVEPGKYDIRIERDKEALSARAEVASDARVVIEPRQFGIAAVESTRARGDVVSRFAVAGRNRIEIQGGMWSRSDVGARVSSGTIGRNVFGGVAYTRYVREDFSAIVSVDTFEIDSGSVVGPGGVGTGSVAGTAINAGIRWNPLGGLAAAHPLKPFVTVAAGPVIGLANGNFVSSRGISTGDVTRATFGGLIGGGFDIHAARSVSLGLNAGYAVMANFSEPVGLRDNFNGPRVAVSIGFLFGSGF